MTTTPPSTPATLTARAISAAHRHQDTAPLEFAHRNVIRSRWERRAMTAANIAAALGLPIDAVIVRDDPDRNPSVGRNTTLGDLIEVTSDGRCWYFIPDMTGCDPLWGWLLGECPECAAPAVPLVQVANLADLGAHLDPDADHHGADAMPPDFHGDPGHHMHCPRASDDPTAHPNR